MLRCCLCSLLIHCFVLATLYLLAQPGFQSETASSVSLVHFFSKPQTARQKKVKASPSKEAWQDWVRQKVNSKQKNTKTLLGEDLKNSNERKEIKGGLSFKGQVSYANQLQAYIEENQYYPRRALVLGQTGKVTIQLTVGRDGVFQKIEIIGLAKHRDLNQAALKLLRQLNSFKPLPEHYKGPAQFIVPILYNIKDQAI